MKFNEETMAEITKKFVSGGFWKDFYGEAPEGAKKRMRVAFWASTYLGEKEDIDLYREYREKVESEMTFEDAAYLARGFPTENGKKHYEELRDEIELRRLRAPEKLDAACEILLEGCSAYDREAYEKTRTLLKSSDDPWVKYHWLWGAVGGNGEDCEMLGDVMDHGHGVNRDEDLAFYWFHKAAMCGNGDACCRLAALYEDEDSPRFDMARVLFWFREAVRRKSSEAQIDLGVRLTVSDIKAWQKLRKPELGFAMLVSALDKGKKRAAFFIGECYEKGIGTARDLRAAMSNYGIAVDDEVYGAKEAYERVKKLIDGEK